MDGKKLACVVLMMILSGIAYGTQMIQKRAHAMKAEVESADADAHAAQDQRNNADTELQRLQFDTHDLRQFLTEWEPVIDRVQTSQQADQTVQTLLRNSGILTVSQKFEVRDAKESKIIPKVFQATLVVQDDFSKTLNWLGELERKLPLARVTFCRVKQGETGRQVNLEIHLDVPLINLEAVEDAPRK